MIAARESGDRQMLSGRLIGIALFLSLLFSGTVSSGCATRSAALKVGMPETGNQLTEDPKVLGEGSMSSVKQQFVAIIRDPETYAALKATATDLPALTPEFFQTNWLIAAFLGERNTSGYSVAISRDPNGQIRVTEKAPRKDAMLAQVLTSPFKVVALPVQGTPPVALSLAESFKQTGSLYRISKGEFSTLGGIGGRKETYPLAGKIQVTRLGQLVTIGFAIVSEGTPNERRLRDYATVVAKDNAIVIPRLSHGSLVDTPSGELRISASFVEKNGLKIDLDTGPVMVPDGYSGKGTVQAEMVAASAN